MSQLTEKNDPRVTPPKKYVGNAEVDPKTGGLRDDTDDASGSKDREREASADQADADEDQSVKASPKRSSNDDRGSAQRRR